MISTMGVGKIFSRERSIVDFPGVVKNNFAGGPKVAKFHFTCYRSKKTTFLRKFLWKNDKFHNPGAAKALFYDAHDFNL